MLTKNNFLKYSLLIAGILFVSGCQLASQTDTNGSVYRLKDQTIDVTGHGLEFKNDVEIILEGNNTIKATEDGINGKGAITISGDGTLTIIADDDAIHSDTVLTINSGNIIVTQCNEGLEGNVVNINGGNIQITANDDGVNASGDSSTGDYAINITGGTININAKADCLDSNGDLFVTGGDITLTSASRMGGDGPLDAVGTFEITGGTWNVNGVAITDYSQLQNVEMGMPGGMRGSGATGDFPGAGMWGTGDIPDAGMWGTGGFPGGMRGTGDFQKGGGMRGSGAVPNDMAPPADLQQMPNGNGAV